MHDKNGLVFWDSVGIYRADACPQSMSQPQLIVDVNHNVVVYECLSGFFTTSLLLGVHDDRLFRVSTMQALYSVRVGLADGRD